VEHDAKEEQWETEAEPIGLERVLDVVTGPMWIREAEDECARRFGISIEAAICLVYWACQAGVIRRSSGFVNCE
jgi:hypothetical protein